MKSQQDDIFGVWGLISYDLYDASNVSGEILSQPMGPSPLGRIMLMPSGYICATLTSPDTSAETESPEWHSTSDSKLLNAAPKAMISYSGPFKLYEENGETNLATDVKIALNPNWIGTSQVRRVELRSEDSKTLMTLTPAQDFIMPVSILSFSFLKILFQY